MLVGGSPGGALTGQAKSEVYGLSRLILQDTRAACRGRTLWYLGQAPAANRIGARNKLAAALPGRR